MAVVMLHPSQATPQPGWYGHCVECADSITESTSLPVENRIDHRIRLCERCIPRFMCRSCHTIEINYNMRTWRLCDDCATIPRVLLAWVRQLLGGK